MKTVAAAVLATVLASSAHSSESLEGFPTKRITLELRKVRLTEFFRLMGEISGTEVEVDACAAARELDAKFKNAPVKLVVESVGDQMNLAYRFDGRLLHVGCTER